MDDDELFGEREAIVCDNCWTEAPSNWEELEKCPSCGEYVASENRSVTKNVLLMENV